MSFLSNIFGGNTQVQPAQINYPGPAGLNSPGIGGSFNQGSYNVQNTPALNSAIGSLQSTFQQQAGALGQLAGTVQPGFSQFRQAGLAQLNSQQQSSVSNLRDTLAQRRILGSSFGQNQISQSNADFAQQQASFIAQSYLQELSASQSLINQQYQAAAQSYQVGINQMNLDTGIAAQLSGQASQISAQMASAQASLNQQAAIANANISAQNSAGLGKLFGTLLTAPIGGGSSLFGAGVSSLFGAAGGLFGGQPAPTVADYGGPGIGSGGFNFLDAQAA